MLVNSVITTPLPEAMAQEKWAMRYPLFHLLRAEVQRLLPLVQITHARCSTTQAWCAGATTCMANLVKETWTALAMELAQPLLQRQLLI
jgi:hypothetical protein